MAKGTRAGAAKKKSSAKKAKAAPAKKSAVVSDALYAALRAVDAVAPPVMPVDRLVGEARALHVVAKADQRALAKVGFDAKLAALLPAAIDALSEAQAALLEARRNERSVREVELEQEGVKLRSEMIADARFALRADREAQTALDTIADGEGLDDEVQDLHELSAFFRNHGVALKRISVDVGEKARRATAIAKSLESLVAERRARVGKRGAEPLEERDRAATLVDAILREIRATGVYAFRNDVARQLKYRSAYRVQHRAPKKRTKNGAAGTAAPPTAPDAADTSS